MPQDLFDAFKAFQNEVPEAGYFKYRDKARSPNKRKFFDQQFANVQNQFIGRIGKIFDEGGDASNYNWATDFLPEYFSEGGGADYDWMQQGTNRQNANRYNPRVQVNYNSPRPGP